MTLAAAALAGVDEVYRVGGAQAIAAMAYGTESIPTVDVIVGPGNVFVSVAKREVAGAGVVGIESPGRPVGARGGGGRARAAGPRRRRTWPRRPSTVRAGTAILVTWDEAVADAVERALDGDRRRLAATRRDRGDARGRRPDRARARRGRRRSDVVNLARARAPASSSPTMPTRCSPRSATRARCSSARTRRPRSATTPRARTTSCPTGGAARFASALRVDDFRKHVHVVRADARGVGRAEPPGRGRSRGPRASTSTPGSLDLRAQL